MVWEAAKTNKMTAIPTEWHRQIDPVLTWVLESNLGRERLLRWQEKGGDKSRMVSCQVSLSNAWGGFTEMAVKINMAKADTLPRSARQSRREAFAPDAER